MEKIYKEHTVCEDGRIFNKFGNEVGYKAGNKGYLYVCINGKHALKHRFIWSAFFGEIPEGMQIDHINTLRDDNRLDNLRLVTDKENKRNPRTIEHYKISNKGKNNKKNTDTNELTN